MYFHAPQLRLPFPLKMDKFGRYSLCLEIDPTSKRQRKFYTFLKNVDEFMVKSIVEYSEAWLGSPHSEEEVRSLYTSTLNERPPYNPKIFPKLVIKDGEIKTGIFDTDDNLIDTNNISLEEYFQKDKYVIGVFQISGLWISAQKRINPIFKVLQARCMERPTKPKKSSDNDLGEHFEDDDNVVTPPKNLPDISQFFDDDDDSDMRTVVGGF